MPPIPHTFSASYILLLQDGNVLLARRYQTGFQDGNYSLPAGHVEPGETFTEAIIREAQEEIGIILAEKDIQVGHVMHRKSPDREYVDVYYWAEVWAGTPENKEPEKCNDLRWFPITNLPDNIAPYIRQAIDHSSNKKLYSEWGW